MTDQRQLLSGHRYGGIADLERNLDTRDFSPAASSHNRPDGSAYPFGNAAFQFWDSKALGMKDGYDARVRSPNFASSLPSRGQTYVIHGFAAFIVPFFSDEYLPEQNGPAREVIDFRLHSSTERNWHRRRSGTGAPPPQLFQCVRSSLDGVNVRQLCDPNTALTREQALADSVGDAAVDGVWVWVGDVAHGTTAANATASSTVGGPGWVRAYPAGLTTGLVRREGYRFFEALKERHWLSTNTRLLLITMQLRSPNAGIRCQTNIFFEFPAVGGVLPSFDIITMPENDSDVTYFATIVLVWVLFFCFIEAMELAALGIRRYWADPWNLLDLMNYALYFYTFALIQIAIGTDSQSPSAIATAVGFETHAPMFVAWSNARSGIALNICLLIMKILKFTNILIPRMSMLSEVIYIASDELFYFTITLAITIFAFGLLMYTYCGSKILRYSSLDHSLISLVRALFGDFDVDEIDDNSVDTVNSYIFLGYLFVAVFILLSMFLAILGEAQSQVLGKGKNPRSPLIEWYASCVSWFKGEALHRLRRGRNQVSPLSVISANAATRMQAVARGHLARQEIAKQNQAARKIQAHLRGKMSRESLKKKWEQTGSWSPHSAALVANSKASKEAAAADAHAMLEQLYRLIMDLDRARTNVLPLPMPALDS
jgi:hypothetical protein